MNKSHRSIWNEALGTWVAASELTAARGKKNSAGHALLAIAILVASSSALAVVDSGIDSGVASAPSTIAISSSTGSAAQASATAAIALGSGAAARDTDSIAIGRNAIGDSPPPPVGTPPDPNAASDVHGNIAIGANAKAITPPLPFVGIAPSLRIPSVAAIAIGAKASAVASGAVALGSGAAALDIDVIAIGRNATVETTIFPPNNSLVPASIAIGADAKVSGITGSSSGGFYVAAVALGAHAQALGSGAVALGGNSMAVNGSVAVGAGALAGTAKFNPSASNPSQIAIGSNAKAGASATTFFGGTNSIAIGNFALASLGNEKGTLAIGSAATASKADSIAIGTFANSSGGFSVALGRFSNAGASEGDVALGSNSTTAGPIKTPSTVINGVTYNFAGTSPKSTVSIGSPEHERTITNVAAGRISPTSTDAINGSQLYATNSAIENIVKTDFPIRSGNAKPYTTRAIGTDALAMGANANASAGSTVAGESATDNGVINSTVLGQSASIAATYTPSANPIIKDSNVALGQGSQVASAATLVNTATVTSNKGVNYSYSGFAGNTNVMGVVSIGSGTGTRQITNVAPGAINTTSTDAINGSQLSAVAKGLNDRIDTISTTTGTQGPKGDTGAPGAAGTNGVNGTSSTPGPVGPTGPAGSNGTNGTNGTNGATGPAGPNGTNGAAGVNGTNGTNGVNGIDGIDGTAGPKGDAGTDGGDVGGKGAGNSVINPNSLTSNTNKWVTGRPEVFVAPVATGLNSTAIGSGAVATATNSVALGNNSNDGGRANVLSVGSIGNERQITNVAAGTEGTDATNLNQLNSGVSNAVQQANTYTDNRANALQDQINSNARMLSGGVAASAAMAVVTPVEPGRYHVSGAVAGYNGQTGIGFNVLKRSDNGQTTLHAGVGWATGGSKAIVRVGFGFSFD